MPKYKITTEHSLSSYGQPVLIDSAGRAYGPFNALPDGQRAGPLLLRLWADKVGISINKLMRLSGYRGLPDYISGKAKTITFHNWNRVQQVLLDLQNESSARR